MLQTNQVDQARLATSMLNVGIQPRPRERIRANKICLSR